MKLPDRTSGPRKPADDFVAAEEAGRLAERAAAALARPTGVDWYEENGTAIDEAAFALARLRRAQAGLRGGPSTATRPSGGCSRRPARGGPLAREPRRLVHGRVRLPGGGRALVPGPARPALAREDLKGPIRGPHGPASGRGARAGARAGGRRRRRGTARARAGSASRPCTPSARRRARPAPPRSPRRARPRRRPARRASRRRRRGSIASAGPGCTAARAGCRRRRARRRPRRGRKIVSTPGGRRKAAAIFAPEIGTLSPSVITRISRLRTVGVKKRRLTIVSSADEPRRGRDEGALRRRPVDPDRAAQRRDEDVVVRAREEVREDAVGERRDPHRHVGGTRCGTAAPRRCARV